MPFIKSIPGVHIKNKAYTTFTGSINKVSEERNPFEKKVAWIGSAHDDLSNNWSVFQPFSHQIGLFHDLAEHAHESQESTAVYRKAMRKQQERLKAKNADKAPRKANNAIKWYNVIEHFKQDGSSSSHYEKVGGELIAMGMFLFITDNCYQRIEDFYNGRYSADEMAAASITPLLEKCVEPYGYEEFTNIELPDMMKPLLDDSRFYKLTNDCNYCANVVKKIMNHHYFEEDARKVKAEAWLTNKANQYNYDFTIDSLLIGDFAEDDMPEHFTSLLDEKEDVKEFCRMMWLYINRLKFEELCKGMLRFGYYMATKVYGLRCEAGFNALLAFCRDLAKLTDKNDELLYPVYKIEIIHSKEYLTKSERRLTNDYMGITQYRWSARIHWYDCMEKSHVTLMQDDDSLIDTLEFIADKNYKIGLANGYY